MGVCSVCKGITYYIQCVFGMNTEKCSCLESVRVRLYVVCEAGTSISLLEARRACWWWPRSMPVPCHFCMVVLLIWGLCSSSSAFNRQTRKFSKTFPYLPLLMSDVPMLHQTQYWVAKAWRGLISLTAYRLEVTCHSWKRIELMRLSCIFIDNSF